MDHLPLPRNGVGISRLKIPYLCIEDYDGGPIKSYPERKGWKFTRQSKQNQDPFLHNGSAPPIPEVTAFLQNWFYFGLLHEVIGTVPEFSYKSFTHEIDGATYITTEPLERLVGYWMVQLVRNSDPEDSKSHIRKMANTMLEIANEILRIVFWSGDAAANRLMSEDGRNIYLVMISVFFLAEYLTTAAAVAGDDLKMKTDNMFFTGWGSAPLDIADVFFMKLEANGWCPSDVAKIRRETTSPSVLYYLAALDRPRPENDHSKCTPALCQFKQTPPKDKYQLAHTRSTCACTELSVTPSTVEPILRDTFPLITVSLDSNTEKHGFSLLKWRDGVEFVAISHIWAEGKGNPNANTLHECLMQEVQTMVNELPRSSTSEPMPFWIDTLLVPVEPTELWKLAMRKLREPYTNARHVLVLDKYLQSVNTSLLITTTTGVVEIFTRVFCCGWVRRLWTLQEGSLAKKLWFQFSDRAIDLNELFTKFAEFGNIPMRASYMMANYVYLQWQGAMYHPSSPAIRNAQWKVPLLRKSLVHRAVSNPDDEALCLFCVAGLEMNDIANVDTDKRMQLFWTKMTKAPASILFALVPKRMEDKGLRWAPTSFLHPVLKGSDWWDPNVTKEQADVTTHGLRTTLPGFVFNDLRISPGEDPDRFLDASTPWVEFRDSLGVWYLASNEVEGSQAWSDRIFDLPTPRKMAMILSTEVSKLRDRFDKGLLALIEEADPIDSSQAEPLEFHAMPFVHVLVRKASDGHQALLPIYQRCAQQVLDHKADAYNFPGSVDDYMDHVIGMTIKEVEETCRRFEGFKDMKLKAIRDEFVEGTKKFLLLKNRNVGEIVGKKQVWYVD